MKVNESMTTIAGESLSDAWINTLRICLDARGGALAPATVSFSCGDREDIHAALIPHFHRLGISSVHQSPMETVAGTIFPQSIWNLCNGDRQKLYQLYLKAWPAIKRHRQNRFGTYFQRLINYVQDEVEFNQIEEIITTWSKTSVRRLSAFQAAIFRPKTDHRRQPFMGFPCLQHVVFMPNGGHGRDGLSVIAFYANQTLVEKAYGNYLGLYRLGSFMAKEMGIRLRDVRCVTANLKLSDDLTKADCKPIIEDIRQLFPGEHGE